MSKRMYEDLKEILCHELNEITRKGDIDREGLDDVYKLSSAITMVESLMKKQQGQQEGNSNRMPYSYEGGSNDYSRDSYASYEHGMSNERGVTDGRDMGRSRDYANNSRDYSRDSYEASNESYRRGRGADGRYVSRDSYDSYEGSNRGSYDSYDSYERGYSRHTAEQMVVSKLQDILANTKDAHIRKAIMQAMDRIDG